MKFKLLFTLTIVFLLSGINFINAQRIWKVTDDAVQTWYYQGGDEFTSPQPDTTFWQSSYPWGRNLFCNKEQQFYSDWNNYELKNGILSLIAKKEIVTNKVLSWEDANYALKCNDEVVGRNEQTFNYSSGMIFSKRKFHYGYYETRFMSDAGKGLWPAFWLYAGVENEEIDIFEIKGERNKDIHVDVHCKSGCNNYKTTLGLVRKNWGDYLTTSAGWQEGFNVIGLEWQPGYLIWYLNGKGIAYWKGNFSNPMWIIANLAIPSDGGPFGPGPDNATRFPAKFQIDYIRYFGNTPASGKMSGYFELPTANTASSALVKKKRPEFKNAKLKINSLFLTLSQQDKNSYALTVNGTKLSPVLVEVFSKEGKQLYRQTDTTSDTFRFEISERGSKVRIKANGKVIEENL